MVAVTWAKTIRCDYPGCQNVAEVIMPDNSLSQALPPGWIDLASAMIQLQAPFGRLLREFCSIHAACSLKQLFDVLAAERKPDGDGG